MSYVIRVGDHYALIEPPSVRWSSDQAEATAFSTVLEAAAAADENRIAGYLVEPCPPS